MRIAYFDEAGIAKEQQEPYLVIGGVLVHGDNEWRFVEFEAHQIIEALVPLQLRRDFYLHATWLFSGNKAFKGLLSAEQRFGILRETVKLVRKYELPVSYGAVPRLELATLLPQMKVGERLSWAYQMAFSLAAMGFQGWFNRGHGDEVAIPVASTIEQQKLPASLKQDYTTLRKEGIPGNPFVIMANFVDALHFAASKESIGLQLADVVAFAIKRHLMGLENSEEFYKIIEPCLVCDPESAMLQVPNSG